MVQEERQGWQSSDLFVRHIMFCEQVSQVYTDSTGMGAHMMSAQNKSRYTVGEADPGGYVWLKSPCNGAAGGGEKRLVGTGWLPSCTAAPMGKTGRSGGLWPVTSHTAAQPSSCQAQCRGHGPSLYSP